VFDCCLSARYGSEFVAARIVTDQIINLHTSLRYMGVPVNTSYMFGYNLLVITSSTIPHLKLNKRHNAVSYHCPREAIAAKILKFHHIDGKINPAKTLSKHCRTRSSGRYCSHCSSGGRVLTSFLLATVPKDSVVIKKFVMVSRPQYRPEGVSNRQ
jgi:hypothetical protein